MGSTSNEDIKRLLGQLASAEMNLTAYDNLDALGGLLVAIQALRNVQHQGERKKKQPKVVLEEFLAWLERNGCYVSKGPVTIARDLPEGNGLVATRDVKAGELFTAVPPDLVFSPERLDQSIRDVLGKGFMESMPSLYLAVTLLVHLHKTPASFWKPYFNILPQKFNTPLYWTIQDFKLLKGSPTLNEGARTIKNVVRQYILLYNLLEKQPEILSLKHFTIDDFFWAMSVVVTRQNNIPINGKPTLALVPFWDMANHKNGSITTFADAETNNVECYAQQDYKKGDQVYIFYGPRPNSELLLCSGFVNPQNENDTFKLIVGSEAILLPKDGQITTDAVERANQILASQEPKTEESAAPKKTGVNLLLERSVHALKQYPTTLEEDERLLGTDLTNTARMIIQQRIGEKQILKKAIANLLAIMQGKASPVAPAPTPAAPEPAATTAPAATTTTTQATDATTGSGNGETKKKKKKNKNNKKSPETQTTEAQQK